MHQWRHPSRSRKKVILGPWYYRRFSLIFGDSPHFIETLCVRPGLVTPFSGQGSFNKAQMRGNPKPCTKLPHEQGNAANPERMPRELLRVGRVSVETRRL